VHDAMRNFAITVLEVAIRQT